MDPDGLFDDLEYLEHLMRLTPDHELMAPRFPAWQRDAACLDADRELFFPRQGVKPLRRQGAMRQVSRAAAVFGLRDPLRP